MSTPTTITTFALQDILLGISDSLNEAQQSLRDAEPYDAFGRPNTLYQLPYLDFQLKVTSEFESTVESTGTAAPMQAIRFGAVRQPATSTNTSSNSKTEILSTLSGRFVASVPNEGLPQTIIQVKTTVAEDPIAGFYEVELEVELSNVAGEKLADSLVEINLDEEASEALNGTALQAMPVFAAGEVKTNAEGLASTHINFPETDFASGKYFILTVNTGTISKTLSISKN